MAIIKTESGEKEVPDGENIQSACEELGVLFGCQNGFCRTCEVTIVEGYENLTELTENEEFIGLIKPRRLACQCRIKTGEVRFKIE
jgi:ferredoxin